MPEKDKTDESDEPGISRREALKKEGIDEPSMPPCDAEFMVAWLFELGPTVAAGMGAGPITHGDIADFQRNTGIELDAWQARTLRRLSLDYLAESHKATKPDCPPPWGDSPEVKAAPKRAAESLRNSIRDLANL